MLEIIDARSIVSVEDDNYRSRMDEEALRALQASYVSIYKNSGKTRWMLNPVTVAQEGDEEGRVYYRLLFGFRRFRAAQNLYESDPVKYAWAQQIPAIVDVPNKRRKAGSYLLESFSENMHREDISVVDEAFGLQAILDTMGITATTLASSLGVSKSWISQRLQLTKLPDACTDALFAGQITFSQARELCRLNDAEAQERVLALLLASQWDTKELKAVIDGLLKGDLTPEAVSEPPTQLDLVDDYPVHTADEYEAVVQRETVASEPREPSSGPGATVTLERSAIEVAGEGTQTYIARTLLEKISELEEEMDGVALLAKAAGDAEVRERYQREVAFYEGAKMGIAWVLGKAPGIEYKV